MKLTEHWLRLDQRLLQRNKIAVVSVLLPTLPPVARSKGKGKLKAKSKASSCLICGRSDQFLETVLDDSRKDLAKEVKMDLARSS